MKRILCFVVTMFMTVSAFASTAGAVSYSDLRPTYAPSSDYWYYVNQNPDDYLQKRSNCYGYVMRLHYGPKSFPVSQYIGYGYSEYRDFYKQQPGEFNNRVSSDKTYGDMVDSYIEKNNGVDKPYTVTGVWREVIKDCDQLGYTITSLYVVNSHSTFVPPDASEDTSKRIIAIVTKPDGSDYHFYMQNSDNKWTHKMGDSPAQSTCVDHPTVQLTNANISQHVNCYGYESSTILVYIDAPGSSDRFHSNGHNNDSYYTPVSRLEAAGDYIQSATVLEDIENINVTGYIDYLGDVDYYVFNVVESGTYSFDFLKGTDYPLRVYFGDATNLNSLSGTTLHTVTASDSRLWFNKSLEVGKRYYIKVITANQTEHDPDIYYSLTIT